MPTLTDGQLQRAREYGLSVSMLRHALYLAHATPSNAPLIFDQQSSEFKPTPFGVFLLQAAIAAEKIMRRNIAIGRSASISFKEARSQATATLGIHRLPIWRDPNDRSPRAYQHSADEVSRLIHLVTPEEIIVAIDYFVGIHHLKEQPEHIEFLIAAWRNFCAHSASHPFYPTLVNCAPNLGTLSERSIQWARQRWMQRGATAAQLNQAFRAHEVMAEKFGVVPRTGQIRRLIEKYRGNMVPVIVPFRKHSPDVIKIRREEFGLPAREVAGTRANFLSQLNDPQLVMTLYKQGVPLPRLVAAIKRGSFGQERDSVDLNLLSVDHQIALAGSDNFPENFALMTVGANQDLAQLQRLQTDFLPYDEIVRTPGRVHWQSTAPTVSVVALWPKPISYGNGKTFPRFVFHPGWRPQIG